MLGACAGCQHYHQLCVLVTNTSISLCLCLCLGALCGCQKHKYRLICVPNELSPRRAWPFTLDCVGRWRECIEGLAVLRGCMFDIWGCMRYVHVLSMLEVCLLAAVSSLDSIAAKVGTFNRNRQINNFAAFVGTELDRQLDAVLPSLPQPFVDSYGHTWHPVAFDPTRVHGLFIKDGQLCLMEAPPNARPPSWPDTTRVPRC